MTILQKFEIISNVNGEYRLTPYYDSCIGNAKTRFKNEFPTRSIFAIYKDGKMLYATSLDTASIYRSLK